VTRIIRIDGWSDYRAVHELQSGWVDARYRNDIEDTILLVEHAPTITVGRKRDASTNVLFAGDWPVVEVERGGDVTWHGPGQLVAYPIVKLEGERQDLHRHLHALEDAVIGVLAELGLEGRTDPRNTGVWLPCPDGELRKVSSVGIACRKWVTWHGLALNVDPDPTAFSRIRPCGFGAEIMTRIVDHGPTPALSDLAERLAEHLARTLDIDDAPVEIAAGVPGFVPPDDPLPAQ
jgi:lipoyl(octanoyl) transferase